MIGQVLGHYRVLEKLGEGGMGVVYKAQDLHLDRPVALKVLPPEKVADPDRKRRFVQEAKAASALNHSHIVHIYDIDQAEGTDFIAMEYVEGQTLDQRIGHRGMRLNDALKYAVQIADALAKAHTAGIVHRDLKPTNVMVSKDGVVKVLDFGLAKLTEPDLSDEAVTATVHAEAKPLTEAGAIVGTVAYMSPEQAEGAPVDARSDIFSLGSVLYEMVTGQKAFQGKSRISTLSAILHAEPKPTSGITPAIPIELERVITRCLRKDPAKRFQHMDDLKVALEELKEESDSGKLAGLQAAGRKRPGWWVWAVPSAAVLVLAVLLTWQWRGAPPPGDVAPVPLTSYPGIEQQPSFSPDGSEVAFTWNGEKGDNNDIYIKQIGSAGPPFALTTSPSQESGPAWSPDDRWIAFVRYQEGQPAAVMVVSPRGGLERRVTEALGVDGLSWTPDGKWLVAALQDSAGQPLSLWAVALDTGERRRLTSYASSARVESAVGDRRPAVSPDGRNVAFARTVRSYTYELHVLRLTRDLRPDGEPRLLVNQRYAQLPAIAWVPNGREILYAAGGVYIEYLWRVAVSGREAPKRVPYALPAVQSLAIARTTPRLAYGWRVFSQNIWRLDVRTGERKVHISSSYDSRIPAYSPDGRKIAFQSNQSGNVEVWTCDADGSNSNCAQLTHFNGPQCGSPRWSPDSKSLALDSRKEGQPEIYVMAADGGGQPLRITNNPANDVLPSWSADGDWIYFASDRSVQWQLWRVPKDGGKAVQMTSSGGYRSHASPDGRYIYYNKNGQPGLFRMPAEGGAETQVLTSPSYVALTARAIYFGEGARTINRLDLGTGKISRVAVLDKPGNALSVSPDEAFLVWGQTDRNTCDLMLVENFR